MACPAPPQWTKSLPLESQGGDGFYETLADSHASSEALSRSAPGARMHSSIRPGRGPGFAMETAPGQPTAPTGQAKGLRQPRTRVSSSALSLSSASGSLASSTASPPKRFDVDFDAVSQVGHGTFGQVMKVTHRLDRRHYAVKRLEITGSVDGTAAAADDLTPDGKLLREVSTLARLSHPHVVRYYQAWIEDVHPGEGDQVGGGSGRGSADSRGSADVGQGWWATLQKEEAEEQEDEGMANSPPRMYDGALGDDVFQFDTAESQDFLSELRPLSPVRRFLFIQMEFCQFTLADLIQAGCFVAHRSVLWTFFRQILKGLSYVHGEGIMHRDVKPVNIFVSGEALEGHETTETLRNISEAALTSLKVKLGDFGLAKEVSPAPVAPAGLNGEKMQQLSSRSPALSKILSGGVPGAGGLPTPTSTDIGTVLYVPPGLRNHWDRKADMYGLGVVLFEMAHHFNTQMERIISLDNLRRREPRFPAGFETDNFRAAICIRRLLQRDPALRPSADELLAHLEEVSALRLRRCESSPRLSSMPFEWPAAGAQPRHPLSRRARDPVGMKPQPSQQPTTTYPRSQLSGASSLGSLVTKKQTESQLGPRPDQRQRLGKPASRQPTEEPQLRQSPDPDGLVLPLPFDATAAASASLSPDELRVLLLQQNEIIRQQHLELARRAEEIAVLNELLRKRHFAHALRGPSHTSSLSPVPDAADVSLQ